MLKSLLGATAAIVLAAGFAGAAHAQCVWNGFSWSCPTPPAAYYNPYYYPPAWQTSPVVGEPEFNGYKPQWLPSYPGPRISSGAGH